MALLKCYKFAENIVKIGIFYRRGVEGTAPYSRKGSKNSTIHEEIVERICAPDRFDHKKISTIHEWIVEKILLISARTR